MKCLAAIRYFLCFFFFSLASFIASAQKGKTILAVFAHPDDEGTVSPVLAKYAAEGAQVYIAVATDGRYGTAEHAGIPEGDSLIAVRSREMRCAAEKLGIHPPIMMGMHDQLNMMAGMDSLTAQMQFIRATVTRLFAQLKPDIIITWGPSGWTGHPDHRLVGSIVSEVFATHRISQTAMLYYPELVTGSLPAGSFFLILDSAFLPIRVPVEKKYYDMLLILWGVF